MSAAEQLSRQAIERGTLRGRPRRMVRRGFLGLFFLLFRMRLKHVERVPPEGGLLVVANHIHNADPILLSASVPRPLHFMAKKEAFDLPVLPWILRLTGTFPVDRGKSDRAAIRRALAALEHGIAVGIFPEGTRSKVFAMQKAHAGAGLIALSSGAKVQPVAITGTERLPMNGAKGRAAGELARDPGHSGVRILFGEPFTVPRVIDGRKVSAEEATEIIMLEIARLLPPAYRGVYGQLSGEMAQGTARQ